MILDQGVQTTGTDRVGGIDRKLGFEVHVQIVNESPKLVMDTYGQSFVFVGGRLASLLEGLTPQGLVFI
jgi:hypothetical protein